MAFSMRAARVAAIASGSSLHTRAYECSLVTDAQLGQKVAFEFGPKPVSKPGPRLKQRPFWRPLLVVGGSEAGLAACSVFTGQAQQQDSGTASRCFLVIALRQLLPSVCSIAADVERREQVSAVSQQRDLQEHRAKACLLGAGIRYTNRGKWRQAED